METESDSNIVDLGHVDKEVEVSASAPKDKAIETVVSQETAVDAGRVNTYDPPVSLRATVRLLSIDGGRARGIIPLVFLQALEEKIGLPYPVQENFHYIIGTSSGQFDLRKENRVTN